jgi:hypothetical protein
VSSSSIDIPTNTLLTFFLKYRKILLDIW